MGVKILSHMEVKIKKKNKKYFFIFSHSQNRTCDRIELIFFFVSFYEKYMNVYLISYWGCDRIELMLISQNYFKEFSNSLLLLAPLFSTIESILFFENKCVENMNEMKFLIRQTKDKML